MSALNFYRKNTNKRKYPVHPSTKVRLQDSKPTVVGSHLLSEKTEEKPVVEEKIIIDPELTEDVNDNEVEVNLIAYFQALSYVGEKTAQSLIDAGYTTYEQVANANIEELEKAGVSAGRYDNVTASARKLAEG